MGGKALAIRSCEISASGSGCARSPFGRASTSDSIGFIDGPKSRSSAFLATFPQLPRGYADGPPDALEYLIHVAHPVDDLDPDPLLPVMVEHRGCELVVLVHPLGDRLPGVVGTALDGRAMQDPIDQHVFRHLEGDHEVHAVPFIRQHL